VGGALSSLGLLVCPRNIVWLVRLCDGSGGLARLGLLRVRVDHRAIVLPARCHAVTLRGSDAYFLDKCRHLSQHNTNE
jgi:hypothetical protein